MTNTLNDFSVNDIIFTENNIYRTQNGLNNNLELYILENHYHKLNWEKCNHDLSVMTLKLENISDIYYYIHKDYTYIYKITKENDNNILNHVIQYNNDNYLSRLNSTPILVNIDIHMTKRWVSIKNLNEINFHINLINNEICPDNEYPYDILNNDDFCGWENKFDIDIIDDFNIVNNDLNSVNKDDFNDSENTQVKNEYINDELFNKESIKEEYVKDELSNDESVIDECVKDELFNEEYRQDPYDYKYYTKSEFLDYYCGLIEWDHQDPKKVLLREEYYNFGEIFHELTYDKFTYLFSKLQKTF